GHRIVLPESRAAAARTTILTLDTPGKVPFWEALAAVLTPLGLRVYGVGPYQPDITEILVPGHTQKHRMVPWGPTLTGELYQAGLPVIYCRAMGLTPSVIVPQGLFMVELIPTATPWTYDCAVIAEPGRIVQSLDQFRNVRGRTLSGERIEQNLIDAPYFPSMGSRLIRRRSVSTEPLLKPVRSPGLYTVTKELRLIPPLLPPDSPLKVLQATLELTVPQAAEATVTVGDFQAEHAIRGVADCILHARQVPTPSGDIVLDVTLMFPQPRVYPAGAVAELPAALQTPLPTPFQPEALEQILFQGLVLTDAAGRPLGLKSVPGYQVSHFRTNSLDRFYHLKARLVAAALFPGTGAPTTLSFFGHTTRSVAVDVTIPFPSKR
ncbi:MAG: hypothetical protein ACRCZF_22470, partial [Gemmataceae bacterium]